MNYLKHPDQLTPQSITNAEADYYLEDEPLVFLEDENTHVPESEAIKIGDVYYSQRYIEDVRSSSEELFCSMEAMLMKLDTILDDSEVDPKKLYSDFLGVKLEFAVIESVLRQFGFLDTLAKAG